MARRKKELLPVRPVSEEQMRPLVKGLLRSEMAKRNLTYSDLHAALARMGIDEDERNLRNKIARGSFSAAFLLQCLWAMNISWFETGMGIYEVELGSDDEGIDLDAEWQDR